MDIINGFELLNPGDIATIAIQDDKKTRTVKVEVLDMVWGEQKDPEVGEDLVLIDSKKYLMYSPSLGVCYIKGDVKWKTYHSIADIVYTIDEVLIPYNIPEMDDHLSSL